METLGKTGPLGAYGARVRRIKVSITIQGLFVIGPFDGCVRKQQAALAMISDFSLYSTAFSAFPYEQPEKVFIGASLDHAIWFHEVPNMSDWILYDTYSPWSGRARGYNRGSLWSREGKLIASTAQEGLMRIRRDRK